MPPRRGGICGRLTYDLPTTRLQGGDSQCHCETVPRRARIQGSWTLVSLNLRLKNLLEPVTKVKKKKKKTCLRWCFFGSIRLETAAHFCEVVVLKLRTRCRGRQSGSSTTRSSTTLTSSTSSPTRAAPSRVRTRTSMCVYPSSSSSLLSLQVLKGP